MNQTVMRLQDYDIETRYRAVVVSSERITSDESDEDVRELVLDIDRPDFPYELGQSIAAIVPTGPPLEAKQQVRLYSVADLPERNPAGRPRIKIAVRRCFTIDERTGARRPGLVSNYLCDLRPGHTIEVCGPFGIPFEVPQEPEATLILIATGTGIAPFRAFVKHIYRNVPGWKGKVWLFYGGKTGLDLLYMNDKNDDFAQYCDEETFEAFKALSPRPAWSDPIAWDHVIAQRSDQLWEMLSSPTTRVYVAGLEQMRDELDLVFSAVAGAKESWQRRKAELMDAGRWVELLY
ncbi:MAG: FAD-binding oxidoreductase [bacterium]